MKLRLLAVPLLLAALSAPAAAQDDYPQRKPITLVTPYAAGGGSDILTQVDLWTPILQGAGVVPQ
jgi:tripartite-type tricarboxylate transporter receptor subunit TctC